MLVHILLLIKNVQTTHCLTPSIKVPAVAVSNFQSIEARKYKTFGAPFYPISCLPQTKRI